MSTIEFSEDTLRKARALDPGRVQQDEDFPDVWWVEGNDPSRRYRVQTYPEGFTCTCQHGLHHMPATCYHAAAVQRAQDAQGGQPAEERGKP